MNKKTIYGINSIGRLLLICLFSVLPQIAISQNPDHFNLRNEMEFRSFRNYVRDVKRRGVKARASLGYRYLKFENPTFYSNLQDQSLQGGNAFQAGFAANWFPLQWDMDFWIGSFAVDKSHPLYDDLRKKNDRTIFNLGMSSYLCFYPLPDYGRFSEIVRPYLGIGYSVNSLSVTTEEESKSLNEQLENTVAQLVITEPMWKLGCHISFRNMGIYGEYRQTLNFSSPYKHTEYVIGLALGY